MAWPRRLKSADPAQRIPAALVRARLHLLANRREDRLVFDLQNAVAETFGYSSEYTPHGEAQARAWCVPARR
jgi:UTP:GlnB (protein PII) uridylyltransferase